MSLSCIGRQLPLVTLFCVLAIFFSSPIKGPYSVVHGPVTALQSVRAAKRLNFALVHAARYALRDRVVFACLMEACVPVPEAELHSADLPESVVPLRC